MSTPASAHTTSSPRGGAPRLMDVVRLFFWLGLTAFGGPAVHIALMEDAIVRQRQWLPRDRFLRLLGVTNLLPGPNSTEMAMHIGQVHAGGAGLVLSGIAFILPAALMSAALAWIYARYSVTPPVEALLYGLKPVVVAVVAQALWRLARTALQTPALIAVAILGLIASLIGLHELIVLLSAGVAHLLLVRPPPHGPGGNGEAGERRIHTKEPAPPSGDAASNAPLARRAARAGTGGEAQAGERRLHTDASTPPSSVGTSPATLAPDASVNDVSRDATGGARRPPTARAARADATRVAALRSVLANAQARPAIASSNPALLAEGASAPADSFATTTSSTTTAIAAIAGGAAATATVGAPSLWTIFLVFLKIGSVLFGSGYVLIMFLRADVVQRYHWLTESQLVDAIAVGQIIPGPVTTTVTFIGYLVAGGWGAIVATVGVFLPAFCFVALSSRLVPLVERSPRLQALLDGVVAGSLALMAIVAVDLARASLFDPVTWSIALLTLLALVRFRANPAWCVAGAAALGLFVRLALR